MNKTKRTRTVQVCSICQWPISGPRNSITCTGHTNLRTGTREIVLADLSEVRDRARALRGR